MNGYSNGTERIDYQVIITKCNPGLTKNCKSDKEIEVFLTKIFFTLYTIIGRVELGSHESYSRSPIVYKEFFHS